LGLKSFVNSRKSISRKIESIKDNGQIQQRTYTTKEGVTKTYSFKGATIIYKDGGLEQKFYSETPFGVKYAFGTIVSKKA